MMSHHIQETQIHQIKGEILKSLGGDGIVH